MHSQGQHLPPVREGNPSVKAALRRHPWLLAPGTFEPQQDRAVGQDGPQQDEMAAQSHICAPLGQKALGAGAGQLLAGSALGTDNPGAVVPCTSPALQVTQHAPAFGSQEREVRTFSG